MDEITIETCDHNWTFCDDSFDHDWAGGGRYVDRYFECSKCGICTRKVPAYTL